MKKSFLFPAVMIIAFSLLMNNSAIQIDGKIGETEWEGATAHPLKDGGELLLKKENKVLWVAIKAPRKSWSHIYLVQNDTIRVLHASAALGEARYAKRNNFWSPVQEFQWQLRERVYNEELAKKQEEYFNRYGWVANNNNTGDGMSFEFKLDLSRLGKAPWPMVFLALDDPLNPHYFPASVRDNSILPKLIQGYTPDSLQFTIASWEKIQ